MGYALNPAEAGEFCYLLGTPNHADAFWHARHFERLAAHRVAEATHLRYNAPLARGGFAVLILPLAPVPAEEGGLCRGWDGQGAHWTLKQGGEAPTLDPSVKRETHDDEGEPLCLHGHVKGGAWLPCEDSNW